MFRQLPLDEFEGDVGKLFERSRGDLEMDAEVFVVDVRG